ncbi:MAG: hypothetical protein HRT66_02905 [Flavobacteriaceae bacterium]|nr:hypothetical protein [Flavobacteriaceae bacterium]
MKKIYLYISTKVILIVLLIINITLSFSQENNETHLNMDATYTRPFMKKENSSIAIGGYLEANTIHKTTEGISEGLSFQARRLTLFFSASISKKIKFLSEFEYEDGAKEIAIEFAAIDVALHPLFNIRAGIIMNPIGGFNQNHDGPKWEFVERPDMAVNLLPATWSNVGFGIYGKTLVNNITIGYEAYLTNGFDNSIIDNTENKTFLPATKQNPERFEENGSDELLKTIKIVFKNRKIGELGLSYMGGIYNKTEEDGITIDSPRKLKVITIDFNTKINETKIIAEYTSINIDIPDTYTQKYGSKQRGAFIDIVHPIFTKKVLDWDKATLNIALRGDYIDWNTGNFKETNTNIGDELLAITPAISFRPTPKTVFRINYKYSWQKDILDNPWEKTATWLVGFSTYF